MKTTAEIVQTALDSFEIEMRQTIAEVERLFSFRGFAGSQVADREKASENARRRLENPELQTTSVSVGLAAARKQLIDAQAEMADSIPAALSAIARAHIAEKSLSVWTDAEARKLQRRDVKKDAQMYAEAAEVVDDLLLAHGISRGAYAVLSDADLRAIARIINDRASEVRGPTTPSV